MSQRHKHYACSFGCSVEAAIEVVGGKWKGVILYHLSTSEFKRFGELKRLVPSVTQKMLTKQLRELEADNIVRRAVYAEVPPRVEYSLTTFGQTLLPILTALEQWGNQYLEKLSEIRTQQLSHEELNKDQT